MTDVRYLLDTNIVSDLIRNPRGLVRRRISVVGAKTICTSVIVACELQYGAVRKGSKTLLGRVHELFEEIPVIPFGTSVYRAYGEVRKALEIAGTPISPNDLFIAAHAVSLDVTLVTHNVREFSRVRGLAIEDWLV